jgi:capsid protein
MARRNSDYELAPTLSAAMRELREDFRSDYNIGENNRFMPAPRGVASGGSGADYHYRNESRFLRGIERARHYDRNDMVVGQAVNRLCANLLQTGYNLDVNTGDEKLNEQIDNEFWNWADDPDQCDLQGEKTFADFELLTLRHSIVDGDCLTLLLDVGSLDLIEAHRVRTAPYMRNKLVHGVRLDPETRKRTGYFVSHEDIDPLTSVTRNDKFTEYPARDADGERHVLHIYDPKRVSQTRGITAFAPIGEVVGMHGDVQFATMVKAQVAAMFAIFEEQDGNDGSRPPVPGSSAPIKTGTTTVETMGDGTTRTQQGLVPGMRVKGAPGVKLKGFAPNIPNPEFFPHSTLLLTFIAVNLDQPVHVLLLDPTKTNFSGWRGAIDQARMKWRQTNRWHIRRFHTPVYRWRLRRLIASSTYFARRARELGPQFFEHAWHPDAYQYIDPSKDGAADLLQVSNLFLSERRRAMRLGMQFHPLINEIIEDRMYIINKATAAANAWNAANGVASKPTPLTWRDICPLPTPQGYSAKLATEPAADEAADEEPSEPAKKNPGPKREED